MIDLKAKYGDDYHITLDESAEIDGQTQEERIWLFQIPAKHGHIFLQGKETLGAYCNRKRHFAALLAIPGVQVHQRGDAEISVKFSPEQFTQVAEVLKAKKRRKLSEENRRRFIELGERHRFPPRG